MNKSPDIDTLRQLGMTLQEIEDFRERVIDRVIEFEIKYEIKDSTPVDAEVRI